MYSTTSFCTRLRYFSGILRQLKLSKLNSAFNHFIFFPTKFTIRTKEEELYTCFMIEIIMIIIKKTQKWESKAQSRFHVLQGLQMAVIFNLKISLSWSKPLTKFTCKIWAKSVGQSVRSFRSRFFFMDYRFW